MDEEPKAYQIASILNYRHEEKKNIFKELKENPTLALRVAPKLENKVFFEAIDQKIIPISAAQNCIMLWDGIIWNAPELFYLYPLFVEASNCNLDEIKQKRVEKSLLEIAIERDDITGVQNIFSQPESKIPKNAIDYAIFCNSMACFHFLLINGAKLKTAMHSACSAGRTEMLEVLSQKDLSFSGCATAAVKGWQNGILRWLIENNKDMGDTSTLLEAVVQHNEEAVEMLVDHIPMDANILHRMMSTLPHLATRFIDQVKLDEFCFASAFSRGSASLCQNIIQNVSEDNLRCALKGSVRRSPFDQNLSESLVKLGAQCSSIDNAYDLCTTKESYVWLIANGGSDTFSRFDSTKQYLLDVVDIFDIIPDEKTIRWYSMANSIDDIQILIKHGAVLTSQYLKYLSTNRNYTLFSWAIQQISLEISERMFFICQGGIAKQIVTLLQEPDE